MTLMILRKRQISQLEGRANALREDQHPVQHPNRPPKAPREGLADPPPLGLLEGPSADAPPLGLLEGQHRNRLPEW